MTDEELAERCESASDALEWHMTIVDADRECLDKDGEDSEFHYLPRIQRNQRLADEAEKHLDEIEKEITRRVGRSAHERLTEEHAQAKRREA